MLILDCSCKNEILGMVHRMRSSLHKNLLLSNVVLLILISFFSISGCNNGSTSNQNVVTRAPKIIMAPNASTPLAGLLELQTSGLSRVSLSVSDGGDQWNIDFDELNTDHSLPVLGFKPNRKHTVIVRVLGRGGKDLIEPVVLEVTTDPLPEDFPEFNVTSIPERHDGWNGWITRLVSGGGTEFAQYPAQRALWQIHRTSNIVWALW